MKTIKEYEVPTAELIAVEAEDVLTSSGFNGEEHEIGGSSESGEA